MEWAPQKIEKKGVKVAKNIFLIYFNYWFILLNIYDCNKLEQKIATKELEKKIKKNFSSMAYIFSLDVFLSVFLHSSVTLSVLLSLFVVISFLSTCQPAQ